MILHVDPDSHIPPFEQVRQQIEDAVADGSLAQGHRLPTVRRLASDLGLAVNTVARAYRELEQGGVLVTRGRHGTFVARDGAGAEQDAARAAARYAHTVRNLGLSPERALDLVRAALARAR